MYTYKWESEYLINKQLAILGRQLDFYGKNFFVDCIFDILILSGDIKPGKSSCLPNIASRLPRGGKNSQNIPARLLWQMTLHFRLVNDVCTYLPESQSSYSLSSPGQDVRYLQIFKYQAEKTFCISVVTVTLLSFRNYGALFRIR